MKKLRAIFRSLKRMQNLWKVRTEHKNFLNIKKKIIHLQRWIRKILFRQKSYEKRKNSILIQTYIRKYLVQKHFRCTELTAKTKMIQQFFKKSIKKIKLIKYRSLKKTFMVIKKIYSYIVKKIDRYFR